MRGCVYYRSIRESLQMACDGLCESRIYMKDGTVHYLSRHGYAHRSAEYGDEFAYVSMKDQKPRIFTDRGKITIEFVSDSGRLMSRQKISESDIMVISEVDEDGRTIRVIWNVWWHVEIREDE